jgi:Flp pilus assembly protein TadB
VAVGIVGSDGPSRPDSRADGAVRRLIGLDLPLAIRRRRLGLAGAALFAVVVGWLYSGIPTVGVVAGLAIAAVPWLFGATRAEKRALARIEAVEIWTRRLADLVRAGGGLHQAILVSTSEAPAPIAEEVAELAGELRGDVTTWDALRRFADRLADPTSDEVIAALMLNASQRGPRLADVLDRVSDIMSDLITMRREVSAGRTDARLSGQILAGLTLAGLFLLLVNRGYMRPYHTLTGQIVLACCVATFVVLLTWMRHLNTPRAVPRLLRARPRRSS